MSECRSVLGVDLASKRWKDVGTALLTLAGDVETVIEVKPVAVQWPVNTSLKGRALANAIDDFARAAEVNAVSIDGPQGWRRAAAPPDQGVGRACERSAHCPGKTGSYGVTYPHNQLGWISLSIEVFDRLVKREHVHLLNHVDDVPLPALPAGEYYVLECFPTVTWRSAGLVALPAKSRKPDTASYFAQLSTRWPLPVLESSLGHDDLQAVVASLVAAASLGMGKPIAHGVSAEVIPARGDAPAHRVEGIIWDASPPLAGGLADDSTGTHGVVPKRLRIGRPGRTSYSTTR